MESTRWKIRNRSDSVSKIIDTLAREFGTRDNELVYTYSIRKRGKDSLVIRLDSPGLHRVAKLTHILTGINIAGYYHDGDNVYNEWIEFVIYLR